VDVGRRLLWIDRLSLAARLADNLPSRPVIEANGGTLVERFHKPIEFGGAESLRFRILLESGSCPGDQNRMGAERRCPVK
jgi:hypothetical protein